MQGAPLVKNKQSFFSPHTHTLRPLTGGVPPGWALTGNYPQVLCVCVRVYYVYIQSCAGNEGKSGGAVRAHRDMLVLVSPSGSPLVLIQLRHSLLKLGYTLVIAQSSRRESRSAVEQCFQPTTIGRATVMPGCFQELGEKEGNEPSGMFL